jgi:hypothetical protein
MTYEEARELVTLAMAAKGLPPPDFSWDDPYKNDMTALGYLLYFLSPSIKNGRPYSGSLGNSEPTFRKYYEKFLRQHRPFDTEKP